MLQRAETEVSDVGLEILHGRILVKVLCCNWKLVRAVVSGTSLEYKEAVKLHGWKT